MTPTESIADAFERYRPQVEAVAAGILRDREEARDVASETFLAMIERGPDNQKAVLSWLLASARNKAINRARDRARLQRRLSVIREPALPETIPPDPRATALLAAASARLAPRDRQAVELRWVHGLTADEVGARMGLPTAAARVVVHRATRRLRRETVHLLAGHHGAPKECLKTLEQQAFAGRVAAHAGCRPCLAVADEIGALSASGLIPIAALPVVRRALDAAHRLVQRLPIPRATGSGRVQEAAAALLLSGSMALTPPAAGVLAAPDRIDGGRPAIRQVRLAAAAPVAAAVPRRAQAAAGSFGSDRTADAAGDSRSPVAPLRLIGLPMRLLDPLAPDTEGATDIRSFEAATVAGPDGGAAGLLFRLTLAEPPARDVMYEVSWAFAEDKACTGSTSVEFPHEFERAFSSYEPSGRASGWCSDPGPSSPPGSDDEPEPRSWDFDASPIVNGATLEIPIPFRDLPNGYERLLKPGATLTGLIARSYAFTGGFYFSSDVAPDKEAKRPSYTIRRGRHD